MLKKLVLITLLLPLTAWANADWKSYNKLDFSISYPSTLKPEENFSQSYLVKDTWSIVSDQTLSITQHPLVEFKLVNQQVKTKNLGMTTVSVLLRAAVSQRKHDVMQCHSPANATALPSQNLDGKTFEVFSYQDGAMMHAVSATLYRYLGFNRCYSIEVINAYANADDARITTLLKQGDERAKAMLQTIKIK